MRALAAVLTILLGCLALAWCPPDCPERQDPAFSFEEDFWPASPDWESLERTFLNSNFEIEK